MGGSPSNQSDGLQPGVPGAGAEGAPGIAGSAGSAGSAGNPGNASSGLGYTFNGGAGGNAGAAGNAGTAGGGGPTGNAGAAAVTGGSAAGGSGGTGAGNGGSGTSAAAPIGPAQQNGGLFYSKTGGGGGGGAGINNGNSGNPGIITGAPWSGQTAPCIPTIGRGGTSSQVLYVGHPVRRFGNAGLDVPANTIGGHGTSGHPSGSFTNFITGINCGVPGGTPGGPPGAVDVTVYNWQFPGTGIPIPTNQPWNTAAIQDTIFRGGSGGGAGGGAGVCGYQWTGPNACLLYTSPSPRDS